MRRALFFVLVLLLAFWIAACNSKDSDSPVPAGGGGGGGGSNYFRFSPETASANPGDTVNFSLVNGTPPFQLGYLSIQSYDNPADAQGSFDPNTGTGSYVVGPNGECTDILAAQDSTGEGCSMTIYVGSGGGGGTGSITANFTATPRSGTEPLTVNFTDASTSTSGITS